MKVDLLLSKATYTSGRALVIYSGALLAALHYGIDVGRVPVLNALGNDSPLSSVQAFDMAQIVLLFLIFSHFINIWGDWSDFRSNQRKHLTQNWIRTKLVEDQGEAVDATNRTINMPTLEAAYRDEALANVDYGLSKWPNLWAGIRAIILLHFVPPLATALTALIWIQFL